MSHIIPYIPTEPPSIHDDSFEQQSSSSEISDFNFSKVPHATDNMIPELICPISVSPNAVSTETRSPLELRHHIDNVIDQNDMRLDFTDSGIKNEFDDVISECSFEGQFDAYIDCANDSTATNNMEDMECNDTVNLETLTIKEPYYTNQIDNQKIDNSNVIINNNINEHDIEFDEFGDFNLASEVAIDYFTENSGNINQENHEANFAFGDFDTTDSINPVNSQELDDDFDDFATFNHDSLSNVSTEPTYQIPNLNIKPEQTIDDVINTFRMKLITSIDSLDITQSTPEYRKDISLGQTTDSTYKNPIFNELGAQIWKELTNFDYSPAFIFHWMQSISYENFMNSMGPDFKELLSSQRATLPLYSVNLTPIEPVPIDYFVQNVDSTTSSSLDLTSPDKTGNTMSEKNSSIDIKNLEDEFVFNSGPKDDMAISGMKSDNRSSLPNLSSAVVQSEGIGGIFKSILKPLNAGKSSGASRPMHAQTEAVLKELPDLSYMSSKVLMFPVLASCDVEDHI